MTGPPERDETTGVGRARANAAYVAARANRDVWPRNEKTGCVGMSDERTGAELLREAAWLMRQRTVGAEWPWRFEFPHQVVGPRDDEDERYVVDCSEHAQHIASWHPGVALAVANWLEATADDLEIEDDHDGWDSSVYTAAVATARAYLSAPVSAGEPAPGGSR